MKTFQIFGFCVATGFIFSGCTTCQPQASASVANAGLEKAGFVANPKPDPYAWLPTLAPGSYGTWSWKP